MRVGCTPGRREFVACLALVPALAAGLHGTQGPWSSTPLASRCRYAEVCPCTQRADTQAINTDEYGWYQLDEQGVAGGVYPSFVPRSEGLKQIAARGIQVSEA